MSSNLKLNSINSNNIQLSNLCSTQSPRNCLKPHEERNLKKSPHCKSHSQIHLPVSNYTSLLAKPENSSMTPKNTVHKTQTSCFTLPKTSQKPKNFKSKSKDSHFVQNIEEISPKSNLKKNFKTFNSTLRLIQTNEETKNKEINEKIQNLNKSLKKDSSFDTRTKINEFNLLEKKNKKTGYKIIRHDPKLNKTIKGKKDLPPLPSGIKKNAGSYQPDSDRKKNQVSRESSKTTKNEKKKGKNSSKVQVKNGILSANSNFTDKLSRNYSVYSEKRVKFSDDTKFTNKTLDNISNTNENYKENLSITSSSCNTESDEWTNIFNFYTADQNSDFVEEFKQKIQKSNENLKKIVKNSHRSNLNFSYEDKSSYNSEETLTQDRTESIDSSVGKTIQAKESLQSLLHSTQLIFSKPSIVHNFVYSSKSSKDSASNCPSDTSSNIRINHKYQVKD